jgi:Zn-dependent peptidase ImmA (M78 family)
MSQTILGINPKVLKWARERAKCSLEDVSIKLKKDIKTIEKWESGEETPTYVQLEKLSYELYKRPIALFFFPEPPEEPDQQSEFRTLPEFEIENLSSDTLYALRQAKAMQLSLKEINDNINPSEKKIFDDLSISLADNLSNVTQIVRDYLGIQLDEQLAWRDSDFALKTWRNLIEKSGIFIFKRSFKQKDISGFCLIDQEFPIIYLNNSTSKTRQIFTIFHELAHLLLQTNGITKLDINYIDYLNGENKDIEIFCNRFASEFLVPSNDFLESVRQKNIDDDFINNISLRYKVSREVVLRKLLDTNLISENYYQMKVQSWNENYEENRKLKKSSGGDYYATQATYLGETYLKLVFRKYYQGRLDIEQLADYLNVKVTNVMNLERFLF